MRRAVVTYILLVLIPGVVLGVLLLRWTFRESPVEALREEAEQLLSREALQFEEMWREEAAAARRLLRSWPQADVSATSLLFFTDQKGTTGYHPEGIGTGSVPSQEETTLFRLSLFGGDDFAFVKKDPMAAVEAYVFFLDRIGHPPYRARLLVAAYGQARAADRADLSEAFAEEIRRHHAATVIEGGFPAGVFAARTNAEARVLLARASSKLPTPALAALMDRYSCTELAAELSRRRRIETALRGTVPSGRPILRGHLLFQWRRIRFAGDELWAGMATDLTVHEKKVGNGRFILQADDPPGKDIIASQKPIAFPEGTGTTKLFLASVRLPELVRLERQRRLLAAAAFSLLLFLVVGGGFLLSRLVWRQHRLQRLRSALTADLSHALKTPATTAHLFAELLQAENLNPQKLREYARIVASESSRLGKIVDRFLALDRLDRKIDSPAMRDVDLEELVNNVAAVAEQWCREQGMTCERTGDPLPLVETAHEPVKEILLNLIDNAVKYRRREGGRVRIETSVTDDTARIAVTDNGPGIPPALHERVFDRFFRQPAGDGEITRDEGTGLGLALARGHARALGGDVTLESTGCAGSTFSLLLPVKRSGPAAPAANERTSSEDRNRRGRPASPLRLEGEARG